MTTVVRVNEANQKYAILERDYTAMIEKVEAWTPPSDQHESFKGFMLDQLKDSLSFDVHTQDLDEIKALSGEEYVDRSIEVADRSIAYYTERIQKDQEVVEESNQWMVDLVKSLPED